MLLENSGAHLKLANMFNKKQKQLFSKLLLKKGGLKTHINHNNN